MVWSMPDESKINFKYEPRNKFSINSHTQNKLENKTCLQQQLDTNAEYSDKNRLL